MINFDDTSVTNAAVWLREEYNIPNYETVVDRFCEEFNCDIEITDFNSTKTDCGFVVFNSNLDELNFKLRWL